jgi:hypothetical protein
MDLSNIKAVAFVPPDALGEPHWIIPSRVYGVYSISHCLSHPGVVGGLLKRYSASRPQSCEYIGEKFGAENLT